MYGRLRMNGTLPSITAVTKMSRTSFDPLGGYRVAHDVPKLSRALAWNLRDPIHYDFDRLPEPDLEAALNRRDVFASESVRRDQQHPRHCAAFLNDLERAYTQANRG